MKRGEHRLYRGTLSSKKSLPFGKIVLAIFNIALLSGIGYGVFVLFISDRFEITNVVVEGVEFIPPQDILDNVDTALSENTFAWIHTKNMYLLSQDDLRANLAKEYVFASLEIDKVLPNTLVIRVVEKEVVFTVITNEFEYLIDNHGEVVRKLPTFRSRPSILSLLPAQEKPTIDTISTFDTSATFPILHFLGEQQFGMSEQVFDENNISFIQEVISAHQNKLLDIFSIAFDQPIPQSLTITTTKGYDVLVSTNTTLDSQIKKLKVVLSQEIKDNEKRLDYVDMRLGNNIYYKYK